MPRIQPKPPMNFTGMSDEQLRLHVRVLASAAYAAKMKADRACERYQKAEAAAKHAEAELGHRIIAELVP